MTTLCHPQLDWGSSPFFYKYYKKRVSLQSKIQMQTFRITRLVGDPYDANVVSQGESIMRYELY